MKNQKPNIHDMQQEFIGFLKKVQEVSRSPLTQGEKRAKYGGLVDTLSEATYIQHFMDIMSIVQKSKDECQPYKNSEAQVDNILGWLPRLKDRCELVLLVIQERRKKYKLQV